jgi:hypothetical protein
MAAGGCVARKSVSPARTGINADEWPTLHSSVRDLAPSNKETCHCPMAKAKAKAKAYA